MACKASFELHHNFPKLAEDSGFAFNTHRPRVQIDWNKIKLIDIESLIRNRQCAVIEQHINDILDCVLDLEFDVRILDEGFLKIFRLAQLAVEYQQFCRHYLDRSVFVLRGEITNLHQELDSYKKTLNEKEEELKKSKRKMRHSIRTPLPYGNDNIATLILQTLNQKKDDLYATSSKIDTMHYNKCKYCEKVFLNQLYLKSHMSRRHGSIVDIPQKDVDDKPNGNLEVNNEISELKCKLEQVENFILSSYNKDSTVENKTPNAVDNTDNKAASNDNHVIAKEMRDAEVSTNDEGYILNQIQQWKEEQRENYNKEINLLRTQIFDIFNKQQVQNNTPTKSEREMIEQLHITIKEQGAEIVALKQELQKGNSKEAEKKLEIDAQIRYWAQQAEIQSKQLAQLLQKLNVVETEARENKAKADAETQRSAQLQALLEQQLTKQQISTNSQQSNKETSKNVPDRKPQKASASNSTTVPVNDSTIQKLQQRAQELLDIDNISSSDTSSARNYQEAIQDIRDSKNMHSVSKNQHNLHLNLNNNKGKSNGDIKKRNKSTNHVYSEDVKGKMKKKNKPKTQLHAQITYEKKESPIAITGSPLKVVRAKLTEEVNNRLVSLGVDPLKNRLPRNVFQKQRMFLQNQKELKSKKYPARETILNQILAHLDSNTFNDTKNLFQENDYVSPNKSPKSFSLSSVLSNVKNKALSLVKSNDTVDHLHKSVDDVTKKAMALLKTPPGSAHSSPKIKHTLYNSYDEKEDIVLNTKNEKRKQKEFLANRNGKLKSHDSTLSNNELESDSSEQESSNKILDQSGTVVNLMKSPIRHPTDNNRLNFNFEESKWRLKIDNMNHKNDNSSEDIESIIESPPRKAVSVENLNDLKQTKGVLKQASSTSSINKKKVLFDMNAIQVKSLSASPSQSGTEKSDNIENYQSGINNLDTEEWDLSSIENISLPDPTKNQGTIKLSSHQSPKIAELKQTIEAQLSRRNHALTSTLVGGIDVLSAPLQKRTSLGGSNTSLASSILDDSDLGPIENINRHDVKPSQDTQKENIFNVISDTASF